MTNNVTTFWGAFIAVLLKCIAALGFATPVRTQVGAAAPTAAPVAAPASAPTSARVPAARAAIPSPRTFEPPHERSGRKLPPTMKQRIRAEAHGASPSARSVTGEVGADAPPAPDSAARAALAGPAGTAGPAADTSSEGAIPAARRREPALQR